MVQALANISKSFPINLSCTTKFLRQVPARSDCPMALDSALQNINIIYLAGGCFWGVQAYFDRVQGVVESEVGYANSIVPNPSYELVCSGYTNAAEALRLVFNAEILTLPEIFARFLVLLILRC